MRDTGLVSLLLFTSCIINVLRKKLKVKVTFIVCSLGHNFESNLYLITKLRLI